MGRTDETEVITQEYINELEAEMLEAAEELEFERAAKLRDRIEKMQDAIGEPVDSVKESKPKGRGRRRKGGSKVPRPKRG